MDSSARRGPIKRRWRHYATPSGARPVDTYLDELTDADAARVLARMAKIRVEGTPAARHLVEDLWEARIDGHGVTHRILFTEEGSKARILLAIDGLPRSLRKPLSVSSSWRSEDATSGGREALRSPSGMLDYIGHYR